MTCQSSIPTGGDPPAKPQTPHPTAMSTPIAASRPVRARSVTFPPIGDRSSREHWVERPMSDAHLRELERRWKETGSVEDEARLLAERVRTGALSEMRLELAAYCGHAASRRVARTDEPPNFSAWLAGLERFGGEALVRALTQLARRALPKWRPTRLHPERRLWPLEAVVAAEAWTSCPCEDHLEKAWAAAEKAVEASSVADSREGC